MEAEDELMGDAPPRVIRTPMDVQMILMERNPKAVPFVHKGRLCILYYELYMAVCGGTLEAAYTAKSRLISTNHKAAELIMHDQVHGSKSIPTKLVTRVP